MASIIGTFPYNISNGQYMDAIPVMGDLNYIQSQINTNVPLATVANSLACSGNAATSSVSLNSAGKNYLINGAMRVAQRGTTYALTATASYGSLDRWCAYSTTTLGVFNQIANPQTGTGFQYLAKLGRNPGNGGVSSIFIGQALETVDSVPLAGQTVVVSFYAFAGLNFSSGINSISTALNVGTGTDQSSISMLAGSWTGYSQIGNTNTILSTSLTRYSYSVVIPSNATQLGFQASYVPTGTGGADDNLYITGVKIEVVPTGTSFASQYENMSYSEELAKCQRYCQTLTGNVNAILGIGFFNTTSTAYFTYPLPTIMRITPTSSVAGTINAWLLTNIVSVTTNLTSITQTVSSNGVFAYIVTGIGTPFTVFQPAVVESSAAYGAMVLSSEL